ncbi:hypothetical protein AVMA1855_22495 [Acidovorax sp. SUPP1855]|uniref:hypothetical protein n=1 Tax=Acidovorax sp. SUPP1855 TaxID=431774 RepID=UPI0023DE417D|nr:hypothetical protein [Acidovorax sp. SUPP1855]GKS86973.1 hypothetical protein AVMA1855_22495 [Acidovorax sp. SUPP1855]
MVPPDHRCEEFELAADAWEWLHIEGFAATWDHLVFAHPDGRQARLFLPQGEAADETASITIFESRAKQPAFGGGDDRLDPFESRSNQ